MHHVSDHNFAFPKQTLIQEIWKRSTHPNISIWYSGFHNLQSKRPIYNQWLLRITQQLPYAVQASLANQFEVTLEARDLFRPRACIGLVAHGCSALRGCERGLLGQSLLGLSGSEVRIESMSPYSSICFEVSQRFLSQSFEIFSSV